MANWIVRSGAPSVSVDDRRILIRSERRVSIKPGDKVLLLLTEKWAFTREARVLDVAQRPRSSQGGEEKPWWEINVSEWSSLPEPVELELFSTSLTFIRNLIRPKLHVRQAYRRLPDADLVTIQRGELFLARETYVTLLGALPRPLQQTFLAETVMSSLQTERSIEFVDRARALIQFIEQRVVSLGNKLIDTQRQWESLLPKTGYPDSMPLCVSDEDELGLPLNLSSQAALFRDLFVELHGADAAEKTLLAKIGDDLAAESRRPSEQRFELLFQDRINERS
jgi:hypothetical protein